MTLPNMEQPGDSWQDIMDSLRDAVMRNSLRVSGGMPSTFPRFRPSYIEDLKQ